MNIRNFAKSAAIAVSAILFGSCTGGGFMGIDITNQATIDEHLRINLEKFVAPEASVLQIQLLPTSQGFSTTMNTAQVGHFAPGGSKALAYNIMLGGIDKKEPTPAYGWTSKFTNSKAEDGVKLKDIDFSQIASNIAKAEEIFREAGFKIDGIGHYDIYLNSDPSKVYHEFELQNYSGSESDYKNGKRVVNMVYDAGLFRADADGNVELCD